MVRQMMELTTSSPWPKSLGRLGLAGRFLASKITNDQIYMDVFSGACIISCRLLCASDWWDTLMNQQFWYFKQRGFPRVIRPFILTSSLVQVTNWTWISSFNFLSYSFLEAEFELVGYTVIADSKILQNNQNNYLQNEKADQILRDLFGVNSGIRKKPCQGFIARLHLAQGGVHRLQKPWWIGRNTGLSKRYCSHTVSQSVPPMTSPGAFWHQNCWYRSAGPSVEW